MVAAVLDHIVISAERLEAGASAIGAALGCNIGPGGAHEVMGTHNRLLSLGERDYLEVIAIDPAAPSPNRARWYGLDEFRGAPRLTNWALRVDDLDAALSEAPDAAGAPLSVTRGENRWRLSVPPGGQLPWDGLFPTFIEWETPCPAPALDDQDIRLISLTLSHPDIGALGWALAPFLEDDRVILTEGPVGMRAEFHTPSGRKTIG